MNFFKTFLAALLAIIVANVLLFVFGIMLLAGIAAAFGPSETLIKKESVLAINLSDAVTEAPVVSPWENIDLFAMEQIKSNSIYDMVAAIETASYDDRIIGIQLFGGDSPMMNSAQAEEIRSALNGFAESGKFIVSYADSYSKLGYYLASTGEVILHPEGMLDWSGLSVTLTFYTGLIEKLGIKTEILRHGTFKAAVEPFMLKKMSPENRLQISKYADGLWGTIVGDVARSRGMDSTALWNLADDLEVTLFADKAHESGLVDQLMTRDQMREYMVLTATGSTEAKYSDINKISIDGYIRGMKNVETSSKNHIAVIYASGNMVDGEGKDGQMGGLDIANKLRKAREDKKVKAVVVRISSGGGSAFAAETIHREMELLKVEKPVVVSMGYAAASGGYYMACPADIILADRMTLTGSIGVFGLLGSIDKTLESKFGITTDTYNTNRASDLGTIYRPMTDYERRTLMKMIERTYNTFVNHVANGRNMTFDQVDAIGGGRVWTGLDGAQIGLVDGFGGLNYAINVAADRAGVSSDYKVKHVTREPKDFMSLLNFGASIRESVMKDELAQFYNEYKTVLDLLEQNKTVQARIPFEVETNL